MKVKDLMSTEIVTIGPDAPFKEQDVEVIELSVAAEQLPDDIDERLEARCGCL